MFAGDGTSGFSGDGGGPPARDSSLHHRSSLTALEGSTTRWVECYFGRAEE
jgi:hypothetical protein